MKKVFRINDKETINETVNNAEYGTLALSGNDNKPYSLPINFVLYNDIIYFHGSLSGKKIDIIKQNNYVSLSIVEQYSVLKSYYSATDNSACPATQYFKSVIIDGKIIFVDNYNEKVLALSKLMEKFQPEGKYKAFTDKMYEQIINRTNIFKLIPDNISAKFKFGQNMSDEKINLIISALEKSEKEIDKKTAELIRKYRI